MITENKMNPEVKALLVADLRSGLHKQTKGTLQDQNGFCCLGRLCDLYAKKSGKDWTLNENLKKFNGTVRYLYLGDSAGLPPEVREWSGMTEALGNDVLITQDFIDEYKELKAVFIYRENSGAGYAVSLSTLNDCGVPFSVLADLIEEQL